MHFCNEMQNIDFLLCLALVYEAEMNWRERDEDEEENNLQWKEGKKNFPNKKMRVSERARESKRKVQKSYMARSGHIKFMNEGEGGENSLFFYDDEQKFLPRLFKLAF